MTRLLSVSSVTFVLLAIACSSSGGSQGTLTDSKGKSCTSDLRIIEPCAACASEKCADEVEDVFGPDWQDGKIRGKCNDTFDCVCHCESGNSACQNRCVFDADDSCHDSLELQKSCLREKCRSTCT